jgi:peptidoglycan/xylan/chitin deacetylase (PgdA/CDA1 family)
LVPLALLAAGVWSAGCAGSRKTAAEPAVASSPRLTVLPWRGHRAALTLTFDDASPSEATEAIPALDREGVKGTFFVTEMNVFRSQLGDTWAKAEREGHELGNHTVDHCHAAQLGATGCASAKEEIDACTTYIESKLGAHDVYSFAYPFVDTARAYRSVAENEFLLARAGSGGLIGVKTPVDWYAVDAKFIEPARGETLKDWNGWVDQAEAGSDWLVLVFHSILPETWTEGVSPGDLEAIVGHAKTLRDVWIDTFVNVGSYLRAERILDAAKPVPSGNGLQWNWTLPAHFPPGKSLEVILDRGKLSQSGKPLVPDARGVYTVLLDPASLVWSA